VCWWCLVHHAAKAFCQSARDACSSSVAAHGDTVRHLQVLAECSAALFEGGGGWWIPAETSLWVGLWISTTAAVFEELAQSLWSVCWCQQGDHAVERLPSCSGLTQAQSAQQNHQQVIGDTVAA
jgi:hypothetical protein